MESAPRVSGRTLVLGLFLIVAIVITVVVAIAPTMADAIAENAGKPTTFVTRTPKTAARPTTSGLPVPAPGIEPPSPSTAPPATWTPAGMPPPIPATPPVPTTDRTPRAAAFDDVAVAPEGAAPAATEVPPALDKEAVQAAILAVKPKLKDCFDQALKQQPGLGGKVVVQLELVAKDGKGYVRAGEIEDSDVASPFFEACVLKEAAGAAFDAPDGDGVATIVYPFRFTPKDDATATP